MNISLNNLFKQLYANSIKEMVPSGPALKKEWDVSDWQQHLEITDEDLALYPNAVIANSPVMELLFDGEKRDMTKGTEFKGLLDLLSRHK